MNIEQRNQIKEYVKIFDTLKLVEAVKAHYPDEKTWDTNNVDIYSVSNYLQLIPRIFKQIAEATINEDYIIYPWDYTHPAIGANNVGNHLSHLNSCINEKRPLNEYHQSVSWMIKYLLENNLWNKERAVKSIIDFEEKEIELIKLFERVKSEIIALEKIKSEWAAEKETILSEKNQLSLFIEQKKEELRLISEALATVTNQKNEVDNIHKNVTQIDSELRAVQKNHNELFDQLKLQKDNQEKEFKVFLEKIEEENGKLKNIITIGEERIKFFETLDNYIKDKQKEITELGGLAAGRALGGVFGLRERLLNKGLKFWTWAVPIITVISVIWLFIVFSCFKDITDIPWINLIINIARSSPVFILMGFVFRQYSKERNLQEEYAFKAAIAQTIKAYSDLMRSEDKPENVSKQQMLKDAVTQVQTPPKLYSEEGGKVFTLKAKDINETLKNLNESIKAIKP